MAAGVDGLLRDQSRPPGKAPLAAGVIERVVDLTLGEPPGGATHWTDRAMAKAAGSACVRCSGSGPRTVFSPPHPDLQALQGSRIRDQADGHRRAVRRSAGARPGPVGEREEPCVDGPGSQEKN
jgi:hypothetical protein